MNTVAFPAIRRANWVEGRVSGYLAIWGTENNPDCFGTYFDRNNKPDLGLLRTSDGTLAPIRLLYEHGHDPDIGLEIIGYVDDIKENDQGITFNGWLSETQFRGRLIEELSNGILGVSSASADHMSSFDETGRFEKWLLTEISLTKTPCESRMPAASVRAEPIDNPSNSENSGINNSNNEIPVIITQGGDTEEKQTDNNDNIIPVTPPLSNESTADCGCKSNSPSLSSRSSMEVIEKKGKKRMLTLEQLGITPQMSFEEMLAALTEAVGAEAAVAMLKKFTGNVGTSNEQAPVLPEVESPEPMLAKQSPENDEIRALRKQMDTIVQLLKTEPAAPQPVVPPPSAPPVRTSVIGSSRYEPMRTDDLLLGYLIAKKDGRKLNDDYIRTMVGKANTNAESGGALRYMRGEIRSGEVMTSTATGAGDEWVATAWSDFVWEQARSDRLLGKLIQRGMVEQIVPRGIESMSILTEGSDPTLYTISQSANLDATGRPTVTVTPSPAGTSAATLTLGTLGSAISYNRVLEEDIVPVALPQLSDKVRKSVIEGIDKLLLNGDVTVTANTNINLIDGTPVSQYYLAANGIRKLPLVTTTAMSRDGGSLDTEDYRVLISFMPPAIQERMDGLVFVVDPYTHTASLNLPEVKADGTGIYGTVVSGSVSKMFGVDVVVSGFLPKTNTAGKVSATAGNNTKGTILLVYAPYWTVGRKRDIEVETSYDTLTQSRIIVASARLGFAYYSASGSAAASYNITV